MWGRLACGSSFTGAPLWVAWVRRLPSPSLSLGAAAPSLGQSGEAAQVAPPDVPQDGASHQPGHRSPEPPGEPQPLVPGDARPSPAAPAQHEPAGTRDEPRVADAQRPALAPLGDLHDVDRAQGADPRLALEPGPDPRTPLADEADRLGVGHPVDVAGDVGEAGPHGRTGSVDDGPDPDAGHVGNLR